MLSVILTGRNDNYGYNQHKRLAISVNGIAHMLDQPGDEIVFVDYNTANDYPPVLEAIADTLTPKARAITRVLRVRPELHARFSVWTPLPLLDSISRNIGIRRTAANKWVLSTTTDMVFVPREREESLSAIAARLPDGFYGLPRFDMPEALWEGVDRSNPAAFLEQFRTWGRDFDIDEIVRSVPSIGFDGPGDFQLVPRADLFRIGAFDERMLLGWHMDANLWRRLALVYGELSSLENALAGYHCDHTRAATANHRGDMRIENNVWRFVDAVVRADLPHQIETWGLPDIEIEEISLKDGGAAGRLQKSLGPHARPYESSYTAETFNTVEYAPSHVFPYIASLIATLAPSAHVGYVGVNEATASMLASFRPGCGGEVLCCEKLLSKVPDLARRVDRADLMASSDIVVIDFGLATDATDKRRMEELSEGEIRTLHELETLFLEFVDRERERVLELSDPEAAKLFVVVNAVHTQFERTVNRELALSLAPFTTRLRYGPARLSGGQLSSIRAARDPASYLSRTLGRPVTPAEAWEAAVIVHELISENADWDQFEILPPVEHLLDWPILRLDPKKKVELREAIEEHKPARRYSADVILPFRTDPVTVVPRVSGFPSQADWDNSDWRRCSDDLSGAGQLANAFQRNRNDWERTQMYYVLRHTGALAEGRRIAVVADNVDNLVPLLSEHAGALDIYPFEPSARAIGPREWAAKPRAGRIDCISVREGGLGHSGSDRYHAVVCPGNVALARGVSGLADLLREAESALEERGIVVFSAEAVVNRARHSSWLAACHFRDEFDEVLRRNTSFSIVEPAEFSLDLNTFNRMALAGTHELNRPHFFVRESSGEIHTNVVLALSRNATKGPARSDWRAVEQWLSMPAHSILTSMSRNARAIIADGKLRVNAGPAGHVLYGPYMVLPAGEYVFLIEGASMNDKSDDETRLHAEAVCNDDILADTWFSARDLKDAVEMTFHVSAEANATNAEAGPLEFRIFCEQGVEAVIARIEVTPL